MCRDPRLHKRVTKEKKKWIKNVAGDGINFYLLIYLEIPNTVII